MTSDTSGRIVRADFLRGRSAQTIRTDCPRGAIHADGTMLHPECPFRHLFNDFIIIKKLFNFIIYFTHVYNFDCYRTISDGLIITKFLVPQY